MKKRREGRREGRGRREEKMERGRGEEYYEIVAI